MQWGIPYILLFVTKDQIMLNKMKIALAGSIAAAMVSAPAAYAADATVDASAEIIEAVTIDTVVDMDFGTIAADATGGTAVLNAASGATSACATLTCVGTSNPGSFRVNGADGQNVVASFGTSTANIDLTRSGGTETMALAATLSADGALGSGTNAAGQFTYYVGGTLTVGANQVAGVYEGTLDVTADYQ